MTEYLRIENHPQSVAASPVGGLAKH